MTLGPLLVMLLVLFGVLALRWLSSLRMRLVPGVSLVPPRAAARGQAPALAPPHAPPRRHESAKAPLPMRGTRADAPVALPSTWGAAPIQGPGMLRRGIVLMEILGPPRALRDHTLLI